MKLIRNLFALLAFSCGQSNAAPLKVFILVGQSNMEGHAKIETFDYIGDDPSTAPLLKMMRGADGKPAVCDHVWISYLTGPGFKDHANADGHMTEAEKREYLRQYEAKLISPAYEALWKRGASNAGHHYLGCAKTFALMGKAFAEALLQASKP